MRQALFCLKTSKRIFFSFPFRWKDKIRDLAISPSFKLYNKRQKKIVFSSDINERDVVVSSELFDIFLPLISHHFKPQISKKKVNKNAESFHQKVEYHPASEDHSIFECCVYAEH
jgi:hypothetical protein